jgi:hypothetical protein
LASWGTCKGQAWGSKGFVLQKISGITRGKKEKGVTQSKTIEWKINHASKGVVVNGSGNGISWITWTQGKKGAISISEIDQSPGAPLRLVSNLCIC